MTDERTSLKKGRATLCVVNYKTEELTKLCLRSVRKHTKYPYKMIVVDNDSGDGSLDYLRSLDWIELIDRTGEEFPTQGSWAQGSALDLALEKCDTEYFVAMHSDTFVRREGWLKHLVDLAEADDAIACVGGGKMDLKPRWQVWLKQCTDFKKWRKQRKPGAKRDDFYIRAICALYRTEILKKEKLSFVRNVLEGVTCGKQLYYDLIDKNYRTVVRGDFQMYEWVYHLAHATMVLNPEFTVRDRTKIKCRRKLERILSSAQARKILNDDSLDR